MKEDEKKKKIHKSYPTEKWQIYIPDKESQKRQKGRKKDFKSI
jgi:hypothetical protein